jgi:hypothetical protein
MGSQKSVEDGINKAVAMVSHYQVVLHSILSSLVLITQLLVQDEIDRQGIALMGLKENTNDEVPTMTASLLPNIHQKNNF